MRRSPAGRPVRSYQIMIALTVMIAHFSAPRGAAIRTAEELGVDLNDEPEPAEPR